MLCWYSTTSSFAFLFLNANEHLMKASGLLSQKYEIENNQHLFIQNFYRKKKKSKHLIFGLSGMKNTFNTSDCRKTRNKNFTLKPYKLGDAVIKPLLLGKAVMKNLLKDFSLVGSQSFESLWQVQSLYTVPSWSFNSAATPSSVMLTVLSPYKQPWGEVCSQAACLRPINRREAAVCGATSSSASLLWLSP